MKREYYKPKWKVYQQQAIPSEAIRNNANLRKFIRIKRTLLIVNVAASAALVAIIIGRLL